MIWLFERENQALRVETRFNKERAEYTATVHWPDGRTDVERFTDVEAFTVRVEELERTLRTGAWKQIGGPTLIRKDWWDSGADD